MRHGKSSWNEPGVSDHERSLMEVGIKKTNKICQFLLKKDLKPEMIMSSTAKRALDTAKIVANSISYPVEDILTKKSIYHAAEREIYDELYEINNHINSLMLFGHNPTFTDFVNIYKTPEIYNLPTSGLAAIRFYTNKWEEISNCEFDFEFLITPKML